MKVVKNDAVCRNTLKVVNLKLVYAALMCITVTVLCDYPSDENFMLRKKILLLGNNNC